MFHIFQGKLSSSIFLRDASILTLGTLVSQALVFVCYPVLTRLYTPAEFGIVSALYMITSLLAVFASGAAEGAIMVAKSRRSAAHIIGWIVIRSTIVFLGFTLLTILMTNIDSQWIEKDILFWFPIIPILAASVVYFNCFSEWSLRERKFSQLAFYRILQSGTVSFFRILSGFAGILINGLVIGEILGKLFTAIVGIYVVLVKQSKYFRTIKISRINIERRQFRRFPKYMMPDQLINIAGGTVHIPFFIAAFGSTELGYVSMSMSILYLPVTVISSAIKDVFRERAIGELRSIGSCKALYLKLLLPISLIGLIGFGFIYVVSPWLFTILLGDNWAPVSEYIRVLIPMFFLNFVSMSIGGVLVVTQRLGLSLAWQIANLAMTFLALIIGAIFLKNIWITLWSLTIVKSLLYLIHMVLSYRFSDV